MRPTLSVSVEDVVAGLGENEQMTLRGQLETLKVTGEVKPLAGVMVIVDAPVPPRGILNEDGAAPSAKPGAGKPNENCCRRLAKVSATRRSPLGATARPDGATNEPLS